MSDSNSLPAPWHHKAGGIRRGHLRCVECLEILPEADFKLLKKATNERHHTCRTCSQKKRLNELRQREKRDLLKDIGKMASSQIDVPHISEFVAALLKAHGGLDKFLYEWKEQIDFARTSGGAGSARVLKAYADIARLVVASTEHRQTAPDVGNMAESDLEREIDQRLAELGYFKPGIIDGEFRAVEDDADDEPDSD